MSILAVQYCLAVHGQADCLDSKCPATESHGVFGCHDCSEQRQVFGIELEPPPLFVVRAISDVLDRWRNQRAILATAWRGRAFDRITVNWKIW